MPGGYVGKMLFVDLSTGKIQEEVPDERLYRDFVGGYGLGARVVYSRQRGGVDPLGPENTLGMVTGGLTGTPAAMATRYVVVGKSPITDGWGDANSGGFFGPHLKFSGYDAVFFSGASEKPVYLVIDDGKVELRDASDLWGRDCYDVEETLKREVGRGTEVASVGPSAEGLALIASIITRNGAAAGRSGLGAVMGSKKLKAIAVRGGHQVPVADPERAERLRREHYDELHQLSFGGPSFWDLFHKYGTSFGTSASAHSGDTPINNWGGIGIVDVPDVAELTGDAAIANQMRNETCWRCAVACEGVLRKGTGEYKYEAGLRRLEYETHASFGALCGNSNLESINKAHDICNRFGIDTIAAGQVVAFAIDCFVNSIITLEDTDGIELTWGNHRAIVAMTEKIARREGFGDVLADGVRKAAERIGRGAEELAVHIGGAELGMHDPKFGMEGLREQGAARYQMDATPGRHTQSFGPRAYTHHLINTSGLCMFGYLEMLGMDVSRYVQGFLESVTGWERSWEELEAAAQRIMAIRQAFNSREGINPVLLKVHPRILGVPAQSTGPLSGISVDPTDQIQEDLRDLDWDPVTARPNRGKLLELGLDDVAADLWP